MPITVLDVALAMGAQQVHRADGTAAINMDEFTRLDLPFFCGCQGCGASLGAFNAYPSKSGFTQCEACITDIGFATIEEYNNWCAQQDAEECDHAQS